jgi:hypothetical protein
MPNRPSFVIVFLELDAALALQDMPRSRQLKHTHYTR